MRRWLFVLGIVVSVVARGLAQVLPGSWLSDAGLHHLALRTLTQAPDGLIWVGTDDGVYRYDGTDLVPLNALLRAGGPLPATACNHLLTAPDGTLWLGTEAGLYCFTPAGRLLAVPLPAAGGNTHLIDGLALAPDRRHVWVGQEHSGLRAYALAGKPSAPLLRETLARQGIWVAPDGSLWLTLDNGSTRHLTADGRVLGQWRHATRILRPVADPAGRVWLLSARAAYRPVAGQALVAAVRWDGGKENRFDMAQTDSSATLFTREQVLQLSWTTGPDPQPRVLFGVPLPLWRTAGWSARIRTDAVGNWWIFDTGARGCWRRAATPAFIRPLVGPGDKPYSVRTIARLPDGRLLVSAYEMGLLVQAADSPLAPLRRWKPVPDEHPPVLMSLVPAHLGPERNEWLAASGGSFLRLNPTTGRLTTVPVLGLAMGLPDVRSLFRDPVTKQVWGGTRLGLYVFDSVATAFRAYIPPAGPASMLPPFAGHTVEDVWADGHGHLWLATPDGVERLTIATGERRLYGPAGTAPDRVPADGARCLYGDATGRLWIGTRTHGLLVIQPDGRARTVLTLTHGLPSACIATIAPGPDGALWLGTYQGVVRYQPVTGTLAIFTTAHGLLSDECNARAAAVDPVDHSLLIGGVAGLHRVWPTQVPGARPRRPHLLLTAITTLSASAAASQPRYLLPADPLPALRLAPDRPIVDLHLALSGDLEPGRTRYAYRVPGWLDGQWLPLGTTARLRLQGLPPGTYEVDVRGETSQGVAAANHLRLPLTVTAEWWRRPTTWALGALGAVLLVYAWQRARLQQARRETALRANLAADLHDEVGALLNRVTLQAELLREFREGPPARLDALVEDSRAAATTVRDIIWSVDATADTLAALIDRIRDHLDATARATHWNVTFAAHGLPADANQPLPPAVRQHVYLIFKEATTNALRHGVQGTSLSVALRYAPPLLELIITNDGRPVASPQPSRAGQGLRNMRHRAELLHAELAMGALPTGGWQVVLRVPV